MGRWSWRLVLAAVVAGAAFAVAGPASADDGYIDCMNRAIAHKDAMIAAGVSYRDAMADYYAHTRGCYSYHYLGGDHYVPCSDPFPLPCPAPYADGFGGGGDPSGGFGGDPFDALLAQLYGSAY